MPSHYHTSCIGVFFLTLFLSYFFLVRAAAAGVMVIPSQSPPQFNDGDVRFCTLEQAEPELKELFNLHNSSRENGQRCGKKRQYSAPALRWSCELTVAAKKHAQDMDENRFLSHKGSDDLTMGARAKQAGYQWKNISENIAQGYDASSAAYQGWLRSRPHCKNIVSAVYDEFGAAKIGDSWVVMFGRRSDRK